MIEAAQRHEQRPGRRVHSRGKSDDFGSKVQMIKKNKSEPNLKIIKE
jgi:hypothetical protein